MKHIILAALLLCACGPDDEPKRGRTGPTGQPGGNCTVVQLEERTEISCPDGTVAAIEHGPEGAPGHDGADCTVTPGENGATIQCGDGEPVWIADGEPMAGQDGAPGSPGQDGVQGTPGSSCHVTRINKNTVLLYCDDGSQVIMKG